MSFWSFLGFGGKPRRVFAYFLQASVGGQSEPYPDGTVNAPSNQYEDYLRTTYLLSGKRFVSADLERQPVVFLWANDRIGAICFPSRAVAEAYPGFEKLTRDELMGGFDHFAGLDLANVKASASATVTDSRYDVV